jgi:hypothetical protein
VPSKTEEKVANLDAWRPFNEASYSPNRVPQRKTQIDRTPLFSFATSYYSRVKKSYYFYVVEMSSESF